jgi:hypothetical protein
MSSYILASALLTTFLCFYLVIDFDNTDTAWRKYDTSEEIWLPTVLKFQQNAIHFFKLLVVS